MPKPELTAGRHYVKLTEFVADSPLSESTIRRRIRSGQIESSQPGGPGTAILVPIDALEATARDSPNATKESRAVPGPKPRWMRHGN